MYGKVGFQNRAGSLKLKERDILSAHEQQGGPGIGDDTLKPGF
jgi:hypothetical protein